MNEKIIINIIQFTIQTIGEIPVAAVAAATSSNDLNSSSAD